MKGFIHKYLKYIVLASLIYMPIFGFLDILPIRIWDESRLAINAYEMLNDGDFIVTHFEGKPDMWNTKPPLLIWIQLGFMKTLGVNEFAVRLPSAIAGFLTCLVLLIFSIKYLKSFWFGFIAVLVLLTSQGYIHLHATRTGDYDALLTLFTTLSGLLFFSFCKTKNHKYLYGFFAFTALAVYTKGVGGLLFLPAIFIYTIIQKQFIQLLRNKHFYLGLLLFLIPVIGYYLLREVNNQGYIAAVMKNEFGGRYLHTIEDHKEGFWFYYNNFINLRLSEWYLLIPLGLIIGIVTKNKRIKQVTLFSSLMSITYFLVISVSQTRLEWYDVPLYPFLSIIIAVFIYRVFHLLETNKWINRRLAVNITPFIFLFLIGIKPYQKMINKTYKPQEYAWENDFYEIGYYLQGAVKDHYNLDGQYLLYSGYNAHNLFYLNVLNDKGVHISVKDWERLEEKDVVIVCQNNIDEYIEEHYKYKLLAVKGNIKTYQIYGKR